MPRYEGRLELTWTNKDDCLLAHEDGSYEWLPRSDYRVAEVRLLDDVASGGAVGRRRAQDNLLIEGDALYALTALEKMPEFRSEYSGKVKLAYIDPPFNTGQAFDQYDDALEHSVWLTMMRDRLAQVVKLLHTSGSVWVHLDDAEMHRCRAVLDEVLGASNFLGCIIWQKADSGRNDVKGFSTDQDYILVYAKSKDDWAPNRTERTAEMNAIYSSPDGDETAWFDDNPSAPGAKTHQGMVYAIQSPFTGVLHYPAVGRCWFAEQDRILDALSEWAAYERRDIDDAVERARRCGVTVGAVRAGVPALMLAVPLELARESAQHRMVQGCWPEVIFRSGGEGGIGRKRYQPETGVAPRTMWLNNEVGHNRTAKAEIKALFPDSVPFATPKPEKLLKRIIEIATNPGDIVLDCFAGSGTTAAVAHKLGRRWVAVERSGATVATFAVPRLVKVVSGDDVGGVSTSMEPVDTDRPEGLAAGEGRMAARVIEVVARAGRFSEAGVDQETVDAICRQLKSLDKVKRKVHWSGGGGFRVLRVAPSMFEAEDGVVYLSDAMTNGRLAEATAAQLAFDYEPDPPFVGRKGRARLAVVDGLVNEGVVKLLVVALQERERVVVCGTGIDPEARTLLKELAPGSTLRKIPSALLDRYRASEAAARARQFAQADSAEGRPTDG